MNGNAAVEELEQMEPKKDATPRVLIVEDVADDALTLRELCMSWGYETKVATDGPSGVRQIELFRPDVVLLDVGLPGFSGIEVAKSITKKAGDAKVPIIIFVTGHATEDFENMAVAAGAHDYLTKPIDIGRLRTAIESQLSVSS